MGVKEYWGLLNLAGQFSFAEVGVLLFTLSPKCFGIKLHIKILATLLWPEVPVPAAVPALKGALMFFQRGPFPPFISDPFTQNSWPNFLNLWCHKTYSVLHSTSHSFLGVALRNSIEFAPHFPCLPWKDVFKWLISNSLFWTKEHWTLSLQFIILLH